MEMEMNSENVCILFKMSLQTSPAAVCKTGEGILTDDNELRKESARSRGQSNGLVVAL